MWEKRFQTQDYVFGTEPARFLKTHEALLTEGQTALSVADGEGRNSVFLAEKGLTVTALEQAPSALAKARKLAAARNVTVDFRQADVMAYDFTDQYDIVVGIFIQFMGSESRRRLFQGMKTAVKPGGLILLHGYTPKQLDYKTGGPPHVDNMYTEVILRGLFAGWEVLTCHDYIREITEGSGHSGRSALIDFIARKPA
jgi:cyclopropane fatty-acyl-phospholipid synthase-like methyltransferase